MTDGKPENFNRLLLENFEKYADKPVHLFKSTHTLKLKRRVIEMKHMALLDSMYEDPSG